MNETGLESMVNFSVLLEHLEEKKDRSHAFDLPIFTYRSLVYLMVFLCASGSLKVFSSRFKTPLLSVRYFC